MPILSTPDEINAGLLLATTIGVFAAFRQIYISNRQKRADLILQLCNLFYQDEGMQDIYYKIEYSQFVYNADTFPMSEDEKNLDGLLGLFSNIAQLYEMKIIKSKDLEFIKYEFQIVFENFEIKKYFKTLDGWFAKRQINHLKFQPFRNVAKIIINTGIGL